MALETVPLRVSEGPACSSSSELIFLEWFCVFLISREAADVPNVPLGRG